MKKTQLVLNFSLGYYFAYSTKVHFLHSTFNTRLELNFLLDYYFGYST